MENAWRAHGPGIAKVAMLVLAEAYPGEKLQLAGTLYAGIVAVCARIVGMNDHWFDKLVAMVRSKSQREWRAAAMIARANDPNLKASQAAGRAMLAVWEPPANTAPPTPVPTPSPTPSLAKLPLPSPDGKRWCNQCDMRVHTREAVLCKSRHCTLRPALTASR
jgi:hypothetical protein